MNKLGIYFGTQGISIVETKLKKPVNNILIPHSVISPVELLEEKVPESKKIAVLIKNELINRRIDVKEATIILSGRDLIIRTFEMPILPKEELLTAINFEAKKFIPFKVEELFSDSQSKLDKTSKNNFILFVGIKKETLNNYLSIFEELNLKIKSIEYSAFSILRLLKLAKINEKGIIAIIDIDLIQNEEANFVVLENGFPLFSRDLTTMGETKEDTGEAQDVTFDFKEDQSMMILEKLKREILVSLNYYDRKFIGKNISRIFFIINPIHQQSLSEIFKDVSLDIHFIDINKYIEEAIPFSLSFIKAYSGSLSDIKTNLKVNLVSAKERATKEIGVKTLKPFSLIALLEPYYKVALACISICIVIPVLGLYWTLPLKRELANKVSLRPKIAIGNPRSSYQELNALYSQYNERKNTLVNLFKKQKYFTSILDSIPRLVPEGLWLGSISIKNNEKENNIELNLEGTAYLENSNAGIELVNNFLSILKASSIFAQYFKEISIVSLDSRQDEKGIWTNFLISCRNEP